MNVSEMIEHLQRCDPTAEVVVTPVGDVEPPPEGVVYIDMDEEFGVALVRSWDSCQNCGAPGGEGAYCDSCGTNFGP